MSNDTDNPELLTSLAIAAAHAVVGPRQGTVAEYEQDLVSASHAIARRMRSSSKLGKSVGRLFDPSKHISGIVLSIDDEPKTKRKIINLRTQVGGKYSPDGYEQARTDRFDDTWGFGVQMFELAQTLIGHKVVVVTDMEQASNGFKVRVLVDLIDLGPATEDEIKNGLPRAGTNRS